MKTVNQSDYGTTNHGNVRIEGKDAEQRLFDRMDNVEPVSAEEIAPIKKSAGKFVLFLNSGYGE